MTDASGNVQCWADYYPFGEPAGTGCSGDNYQFAGLYSDAAGEDGGHSATHRRYSDTYYRWFSPDPAGMKVIHLDNPQTWNMYAYVTDNPTSLNDPLGLVQNPPTGCIFAEVGLDCSGPGDGDISVLPLGFINNTIPASAYEDTTYQYLIREEVLASASQASAANNTPCSISSSSLDDYLGMKNSPMIGQGTNLMNSAQRYNLDPRLFVSLAGAETTFGKNITAGSYNAFNILYNGNDSPFRSWQGAINSVGYSLTNPKNGYDLTNTTTMYHTYCTTGSTCGAGLKNVNKFMTEQGANPNALHYPCN